MRRLSPSHSQGRFACPGSRAPTTILENHLPLVSTWTRDARNATRYFWCFATLVLSVETSSRQAGVAITAFSRRICWAVNSLPYRRLLASSFGSAEQACSQRVRHRRPVPNASTKIGATMRTHAVIRVTWVGDRCHSTRQSGKRVCTRDQGYEEWRKFDNSTIKGLNEPTLSEIQLPS